MKNTLTNQTLTESIRQDFSQRMSRARTNKSPRNVVPQQGDHFDISLSEMYNIESIVLESNRDSITIAIDDTAIAYLKEHGVRLTEKKHGNSKIYDKCWKGYRKNPNKKRGEAGSCVPIGEAEYQGRKVTLNKPTRGDVKKFKVYVKDPKTGNVKKVNFGDPDMKIRKSNPDARKSFRARHKCDTAKDKTSARYWSCKAW